MLYYVQISKPLLLMFAGFQGEIKHKKKAVKKKNDGDTEKSGQVKHGSTQI